MIISAQNVKTTQTDGQTDGHGPQPSLRSEPHKSRLEKSETPQGKVQREVNIYHNGPGPQNKSTVTVVFSHKMPRASLFMLLLHAVVSLSLCMGGRVHCKI